MKELVQQLERMTMSMRVHPECVYEINTEFCDYVEDSIEILRKYPQYTRIDWNTIELTKKHQ